MLRTGPWQAIPAPGRISSSWRVSSNEGTMPMSASPDSSASAHAEGRRNSSSNIPLCGPCSMPQTKGEVFRKLTAQTRGLGPVPSQPRLNWLFPDSALE